jgi:PAS domain S-box-containing protein
MGERASAEQGQIPSWCRVQSDASPLDDPFTGDDTGAYPAYTFAMTENTNKQMKVEIDRRRVEEELAQQRILLASIIDTIPDLIHVKDDDGRYLQCNTSFTEFLGRDRDQIIGRTDYDLFDEETAELFRGNDQEVKDAGTRRSYEEWVTDADGTERLLDKTKTPFQDSAGKAGGVLGISRDITERYLAAKALAEADERQRLVLDSAGEGIFGLDIEGRVSFCNRGAADMLGYGTDELLGASMHQAVHYAHADGAVYDEDACPMRETFRNGVTRQIDGEVLWRKDGTAFPVEYTATPISNDGSLVGAVVVFRDITERKRTEQELKDAKEEADAANQAKSSFLANMSHELRTPMNAILGYSEMLMDEAEDTGQEDFIPDLKKIHQAGSHLLALINDILDLSKVESGKMEAYAEDINIDSLIDDVSATAHPLMEKNNNTLSIERVNELGNAHQDMTKLRQVMFNLLSNAAKFTHEGTITMHVNRARQGDTDWLTFAVSDTGIGIAEDKLDHVFDEFTQADGSTTRDYGGTGLGLAISRRFCELLGGDLTVDSVVGEGSTFTIYIPAILPGTEPKYQPDVITPATPEAEQPIIHEAASGSTILVIDDDPDACEIIEHNLTKDGFNVVTATSGEQGLRLAHEIQPTAITLDVMMPDMDGWSILRALKADPVLHNIPVIMLTMVDDRSRGYSLGAVDYLTKPVDKEQLHKVLSRYYSEGETCSVLLVDDDTEIRDLMARTLEKAGWFVSGAGNGQEALEIMDSQQPRLILLDLMMPVMDGFGFLATLRARPEWQHIPVIVVTAKDLTEEDRDRLNGMVEEVLEKNAYAREDLLERVREAVAACNTSQPDTNDT